MSNKVLQKTVKISSKGQITIPKAFLENLGLKNGDFAEIIEKNNIVEFRSRQKEVNQILDLLHKNIQPDKNLLQENLDKAILEAKTQRYKNKN
jgi:AbrB family looped-hinge helix DNA binding protein